MNLYLKFQSRPLPECADAAFALMLEPRCYCGSASQSTTQQTSQNYQVGLQTAPGAPGVALGAGSSAGAINASSTTTGSFNTTTISGDVATSLAGLSLAGQAITEANTGANQSEDIVGGIGTAAINAGTSLGTAAINLGGAALNAGNTATLAALQFSQNQSALNYNELNQQTALAFSTINALDTANAAGQVSGAAQDALAASLAAAQSANAAPTVIYQPSTQQPYQQQSGSVASTTSNTTWIVLGLVGIAAIIFGPKLLKHA